MTCSKCGKELPGDAKFCPECGAASSASSQSGVEADVSLGGLRTRQAAEHAPENSPLPDHSLNSLPTMGRGSPKTQPPIPNSDSTPLASRYELLEEIGRGGFATVWKARDRKLDRVVAVKRLLAEALRDRAGEQTLARFRREAQAIANLNHRNIVAVYDHDRDAEGDYIVMEYVAGGTLRQHLKERGGQLPVPEALALVRGIAQGLACAHRRNLVHRDIKPGNILLCREGEETVPKIVDFGLARMGSDSELSLSGYGMGTPWYMPPEQRRDAKGVNHTADIYALGKVLYELVSGETPDNVDPEKLPPALAKIVLKCCKSNPEERFFSCEEMLAALEAGAEETSKRRGGGAAENACPACGAANVADVKFCVRCGAGMTRLCSECGRENSVNQHFCGGCGTDDEGFVRASETLKRMERYAGEKRWSRVIKEARQIEENPPRLPGEKGRALLAQVASRKRDVENAQLECQRLRRDLDRQAQEGDFKGAAKSAAEYIELDPHDEALAELAGKIKLMNSLVRKADEAADIGDVAAPGPATRRGIRCRTGRHWTRCWRQSVRRFHRAPDRPFDDVALLVDRSALSRVLRATRSLLKSRHFNSVVHLDGEPKHGVDRVNT